MSLHSIPVTLREAQQFVGALHRHHDEPVGHVHKNPSHLNSVWLNMQGHSLSDGAPVFGTPPALPEGGFSLDDIATACANAGISDSKYESLCLELAAAPKGTPA